MVCTLFNQLCTIKFQVMEPEASILRPCEVALIFHSDCHQFVEEGLLCNEYADGDFLKVLLSSKTEEIFHKYFPCEINLEDSLSEAVNSWLVEDGSIERQVHVLTVGAAALLAFLQANWTGPPLNCSVSWLNVNSQPAEEFHSQVVSRLVLDGESVYCPVQHPELLLLARACLFSDKQHLKSSVWWKFRCSYIHQQILEEWSPQLHRELLNLKKELQHLDEIRQNPELYTLSSLEVAQMHLFYHEIQASNEALKMALNSSEMTIDLIGALGKRTRFQQKEISQLILKVQSNEVQMSNLQCSVSNMPKDLALNDDVRLNEIALSNPSDGKCVELGPLQQACVLGIFVQTQRSQPKDQLADEELLAYISFLLSHPRVWSIHLSTLFYRCRIESNHSRTVERSMMQAQELLSAVNNKSPGPWDRLSLAFCAYLVPRWRLEEELANLLVSLGCVNSALDIFLRLHSWEQVVACYNHLQLRHKSAEIIKQELEKKETVKLWCLLGDATDEVACYERAWALSGERSARAQRHWGLYFFNRKQYEDAIPHLQLSLTYNSLQTTLWFQLGYAALHQEDWASAANAYRRYCCLDPENFEAWNNLAKAYVKQGQKNRAWKALQEALKWNFENWRVWDNYMIVSLDCAAFDEVIRAYHRVLDLKDKHIDTEVLDILVKAIVEDLPDCDGLPAGRLSENGLKLFGRLTAQVTSNWKLWHLYSRLAAGSSACSPETQLRAVQLMQKAHRCAVVDAGWSRDSDIRSKVLDLSLELSRVSLDYAQSNPVSNQSPSVLSSAKLTLRAVIAKLKQDCINFISGQVMDEVLPQYEQLEKALEEVVSASEALK